jgi:hypothetical protein
MNSRYGKSLAIAALAILRILPPAAPPQVGRRVHRLKSHRAYLRPNAGDLASGAALDAEPPKICLTRAEYFTLISANGPRAFSTALKAIVRDRGLPVNPGSHAGYDWYYLGDPRT